MLWGIMLSIDRNEALGRAVEKMVQEPTVSARIAQAIEEARKILLSDPERLAGTVPIDLSMLSLDVSREVRSCRLSVMRGGSACKVERHPNGTQFVYSLEESGTISIFDGATWTTTNLVSDASAPLAARWHVVPANTWHQPVPAAKDWAVLAFHTAPAHELIDDYDYDGPPRQM